MARISIGTPDKASPASPPPGMASSGDCSAYFDRESDPLHLYQHRLEPSGALYIGPMDCDCVGYVWEGARLGGRRRPRGDSPHVALRNASFRAYADHMESAEFREGVGHVLALAQNADVALMCAERLPWQCHRYMISDYLAAQGVEVRHVIDAGTPKAHAVRAEARLAEGRLVYDGNTQTDLGID